MSMARLVVWGVSCNHCGAVGPTATGRHAARREAEAIGWQLDYDDRYDACPTCFDRHVAPHLRVTTTEAVLRRDAAHLPGPHHIVTR